MNPKLTLEHATCACLPAPSLASLAGLRRVEGISVMADGPSVWVFWQQGDERVLRSVLPIEGVALYERRDDFWHRAGCALPSFGVPPAGELVPLARALTPEPFVVDPSQLEDFRPLPLSLARDYRPRPTTAALCPLAELGRWADQVPSARIESIRGVVDGDSALVLGDSLPSWPDSTRYWGVRLLVPTGFEPRPNLPEEAILESLGSNGRSMLRLVPDPTIDGRLEVEEIPLEAFHPLSRAGIRLALVGVPSS